MADFGYDVSDYTDIDPIFGTLADFDALLADAHARGMKLLLDYVPNHTSDRHPWFIEARSSRAKRQTRLVHLARPGAGWRTAEQLARQFRRRGVGVGREDRTVLLPCVSQRAARPQLAQSGSAAGDARRAALLAQARRRRLSRRCDASFDQGHRCFATTRPIRTGSPVCRPYRELLTTYTADLPEVQEIVALMRGVVEEYDDRMLIGEIYLPVERLMAYYGASGKGAHLPFNFQLIRLPWRAKEIAQAVERYEALLPSYAWPNWVLGNHDKPRIATRAGAAQARVAAMLLLTLRGTPTMYYGDEIGMLDVPISPEQVQDPFEKNVPGLGLGRDPVRTPMHWTAGEYAGFSTAEPWLPLAADYKELNVAMERADSTSLLMFYRRLIELRRAETALSIGSYAALPAGDDLMAYMREADGRRLLIALNFGAQPRRFDLRTLDAQAVFLLSTHLDRSQERPGRRNPIAQRRRCHRRASPRRGKSRVGNIKAGPGGRQQRS